MKKTKILLSTIALLFYSITINARIFPSNEPASAASPQQSISTPSGTAAGHSYVDLGLSVKWATMNVGASRASSYGDYFTMSEADYFSWGGGWRLPTKYEIDELIDRCAWIWTNFEGRVGYIVIGPNDNSIFLPASGLKRYGSVLLGKGERGYYWSSTYEDYPSSKYELYFTETEQSRSSSPEYLKSSFSIRPVIK